MYETSAWYIFILRYFRAKTIAFHLQKGGVGKTTISGTLACQSALDGFKTLLIDVDPQGNASSWFLKKTPKYELADVVQGRCYINDAIVPVDQVKNLYLLPTFGIGGVLKNYSETKLSEEPFVLQDLVNELTKDFDHIILDLSPGLGRLERSAIIASDEVITPMTPEVFSLDGLEIFIDELMLMTEDNPRGMSEGFCDAKITPIFMLLPVRQIVSRSSSASDALSSP